MIAPDIGWALMVYALMDGEHVGIRVVERFTSEQSCQEIGDQLPPAAVWECVVGHWRTPMHTRSSMSPNIRYRRGSQRGEGGRLP